MTTSDDDDGQTATGGLVDGLVGYHLRRASAVFGSSFGQAMDGTGLRQVLFGILSVIRANPGINQGMAGRALGIQRANMVSLINELSEAGLVDRQVAEDDRRAFALTVTARGEEVLTDAFARISADEERLLADLDADERRQLIRLLDKIEKLSPT